MPLPLAVRALSGLLFLSVVLALALFITAGTVHYFEACLFLAPFTAATSFITISLLRMDRPLLQRRTAVGTFAEKQWTQKVIQSFAHVAFLALLVVPGLDHRFGWSHLPVTLVIFGDVLVVLGMAIVFRVFRENSFASATIAVGSD